MRKLSGEEHQIGDVLAWARTVKVADQGTSDLVGVDEAAVLGNLGERGHPVAGPVLPDGAGRRGRRPGLLEGHAEVEIFTSHDHMWMGRNGARFDDGIGELAQDWTPTGQLPGSSGRIGQGRDSAASERHGAVHAHCHRKFNSREYRRVAARDEEGTTATTTSWDLKRVYSSTENMLDVPRRSE